MLGLQEEADKLLPIHFDNMPSVKVYERGDRNNKCVFTNAKYYPREEATDPFIIFNGRYLEKHSWKDMLLTLRHELVHAWLDWQGKPHGHTKEFLRKAIEVGCNVDYFANGYHARWYRKAIAEIKSDFKKSKRTSATHDGSVNSGRKGYN